MKRLRINCKTILRDIDRKFGDNLELHNKYATKFYLYIKSTFTKRKIQNKIYSLHEIDAYAVNKGKDHKGYEYGTKSFCCKTKNSGIIVGVSAHREMNMIVKL